MPKNLANFVNSLEEEADQVYIYLAVRELAHSRLFKHSKWLRGYIVNLITSYASEITIDNTKIVELSEGFDPSEIGNIQKLWNQVPSLPQELIHKPEHWSALKQCLP